MSDSEDRQLARHWKVSGSVKDLEAYLVVLRRTRRFDEDAARNLIASRKLEMQMGALDLYEIAGGRIAVFCRGLRTVNLIGSRPGWGAFTFKLSTSGREMMVDAFREGVLKGIALTYRAGCEGIRLESAKWLILLGRHPSKTVNLQAEARVGPECRIVRF